MTYAGMSYQGWIYNYNSFIHLVGIPTRSYYPRVVDPRCSSAVMTFFEFATSCWPGRLLCNMWTQANTNTNLLAFVLNVRLAVE